jgi:hypothetical protein
MEQVGSPPLSPKPRWSKMSANTPAAANRAANAPSLSLRVPESPWAMTTTGSGSALASAGR